MGRSTAWLRKYTDYGKKYVYRSGGKNRKKRIKRVER
jgi:hypothetical protein